MISPKKQKVLETLLQENIHITHNAKVLRKGVFLLYSVKDYYVSIMIKTAKDVNKTYEMPYPFDMVLSEDETQIIFDYRLSTLCNGNIEKETLLRQIMTQTDTNNKFLDSVVCIEQQS